MAPTSRVVLQSRLSSSRLPGKAMLGVAGLPMAVLAARRAASSGADVVLATSDRPEDDVVVDAATRHDVAVARGPLDDPLRRFVVAVADLPDDAVVVRLTADNVVPDGDVVSLVVDAVAAGRGYARLGGDDPALPYGVAAEAFTAGLLRQADQVAEAGPDREHVTPWLRRRCGDHRVDVADADPRWAGLRCTVDTLDDYVRLVRACADVPDATTAPWRRLVDGFVALGAPAGRLPPRGANVLGQGPLVLGTVQLGLPYGAANATGQPDLETARDILEAATRGGVTHLDSARAYGQSEERIGSLLASGLREHLGVVTKVRPLDQLPTDAPAAWGRDAVSASVEVSRRHLGGARLDGVLTHRAADWHRPGVRDAMAELVDSGATRVVGVSLATPQELLAVLEDPLVGYVQLPFNVLDRRWLAARVTAALADRPDVVVTCRSTYLQGLLTGPVSAWPERHRRLAADVHAGLTALTAELGRASVADLCLAYVLGHPWVTSVVAGAETSAQVRDTVAAVARPPLDDAGLAAVRTRLPEGAEDLLDPARWRSP